MRKGHSLFSAVLANFTFLATDVLACSMCITALADNILPPIFLWVLIATTWFVLNSVVGSVSGITLKWYPKRLPLVLSIAIAIILFCLAGAFAGMGVMLVMFVPAVAAFVQSFNPRLRSDFPRSTLAIYLIGVLHLVWVMYAVVLMVNTHLTRTPEKFIVKWDGTSIASMKFEELKAKGPQALMALRYIKKNGEKRLAAEAAERIKAIEGSQNDALQLDQTQERNEKNEDTISQADGKIDMPEKELLSGKIEAPLATESKSAVAAKPSWTEPKTTNSIGMTFVYIKPGTFMMGSPLSEPGRESNETQHQVTLTKGYYMQTTEVTQGQWKAVTGKNPSYNSNCGNDCPVGNVSFNDALSFIQRLNQKEGGESYRFPTEAEWEYACRAGTNNRFSFGESDSQLKDYAWCYENSGDQIHPVAKKQPNAWGLFDMHGNVFEWCHDWMGDYPSRSVTDPVESSGGSYIVNRGGSFYSKARICRSASRSSGPTGGYNAGFGFRIARTR